MPCPGLAWHPCPCSTMNQVCRTVHPPAHPIHACRVLVPVSQHDIFHASMIAAMATMSICIALPPQMVGVPCQSPLPSAEPVPCTSASRVLLRRCSGGILCPPFILCRAGITTLSLVPAAAMAASACDGSLPSCCPPNRAASGPASPSSSSEYAGLGTLAACPPRSGRCCIICAVCSPLRIWYLASA